jgi:hypothetical protein
MTELIVSCIGLGLAGLGHARLACVVPTVNPPVQLPMPVERCICMWLWLLRFNQPADLFDNYWGWLRVGFSMQTYYTHTKNPICMKLGMNNMHVYDTPIMLIVNLAAIP